MMAYCLSCKKKMEMKPTSKKQNKNGTYTIMGNCSGCDRKIAAITSKSNGETMKI